MIDAGVGGWRNCAGRIETSPPGHAHLIGRTLALELEKYGYEEEF